MGKELSGDVVNELEIMLGLDKDTVDALDDKEVEDNTVIPSDTVDTVALAIQDQNEITKDILKIDIQIEALNKADVDMDDFYANIETILTEDEQALEFENKSQYMKLVAQKAKAYEVLHSNDTALAQLQKQKQELENTHERSVAISQVSSKYPDFDYEKVFTFFENKLTKEQQRSIGEKSKSYLEVYENTYKMFIEANPSEIDNKKTPNIPNLNNVRKQNLASDAIDNGFISDDDKLRAALGI